MGSDDLSLEDMEAAYRAMEEIGEEVGEIAIINCRGEVVILKIEEEDNDAERTEGSGGDVR